MTTHHPHPDDPIGTTAAARAAGLDTAPSLAELEDMAATIVATADADGTCTAQLVRDGDQRQCTQPPGHDGAHDDGDWMWIDAHPRAVPARTEHDRNTAAGEGAQQ